MLTKMTHKKYLLGIFAATLLTLQGCGGGGSSRNTAIKVIKMPVDATLTYPSLVHNGDYFVKKMNSSPDTRILYIADGSEGGKRVAPQKNFIRNTRYFIQEWKTVFYRYRQSRL